MGTTDRSGSEGILPEQLFLNELGTIARAIRGACEGAGLRGADADDFASHVNLKLIDNDYAVIRKYERRSSFAGYISVVVQRMLIDYRIAQWGKWHASAEAKRGGEAAVTIEVMLCRDGRTVEEILPLVMRRWPSMTRKEFDAIVSRLPARAPRARTVALEPLAELLPAVQSGAATFDRDVAGRRLAAVVREALASLEPRDRLILRLHFGANMKISDVARITGLEQKPLYRRLQRALAVVRKRLDRAGFRIEDIRDVLAVPGAELDFGLEHGTPAASERDEEQL